MRNLLSRRRLLVGTAASVAVIAVACAAPTQATQRLPVLGYQVQGDATALIDASARALGSVGVDGVNISPDGSGVDAPGAAARGQLAAAHAHGLPAEYLVGNFNATTNDFDESAANRLLSSAANIDNVVSTLSNAVSSQGWDGVSIDVESLAARDTDGLARFVTSLRRALPAGKTISIAVTTYTNTADYAANGWDLPTLGPLVDRVVLMAYDEHSNSSGPGPVGELSWQSAGLDALTSQVAPGKVDLGVAGYGYSWKPTGAVTQLSDQGARDLASADGATTTFDSTTGEWNATLSDGTVLWWSDAQSLAARRTLAAVKGIHGLAVWDLGLSDTIQP
ncbi:hypothetical protein GCM10010211_80670 [Streptomyces albospinus]|uniref:GH18 domain-containing protein n=1 Tax=Streptomyces albospinus TaxID=285515 RepID=A0ABQ2VQC3_9ACTN|nr:glycosyl hydrolase family 18 protein [Streptomyces albospinus]GGV01245.1 hypothetical protein GCM10010211_80670 [Streptomyces albospinus]